MLFVDHQTGLISGLVRDHTPEGFKNGVLALAAIAKFFHLPVVMSTSFENGPNGPLLPELTAMFPGAPTIARPGQINAWDNEDFVKAVEATGRKQLIIAGVVFAVIDASGTTDSAVRDAAWLRMSQAGVQLVNWFAVASEVQRVGAMMPRDLAS